MKKISLIFIGIVFIISCSGSDVSKSVDQTHPKINWALKSIALDLKEKLPENSTVVVILSDRGPLKIQVADKLSIKIVEIGAPKINVVERQNLNKAMNELKLQASETFDEEKTISLGKFVGAKYALLLTVVPYYNIKVNLFNNEINKDLPHFKVEVRVKLIELSTTKILWAKETLFWQPQPIKDDN